MEVLKMFANIASITNSIYNFYSEHKIKVVFAHTILSSSTFVLALTNRSLPRYLGAVFTIGSAMSLSIDVVLLLEIIQYNNQNNPNNIV